MAKLVNGEMIVLSDDFQQSLNHDKQKSSKRYARHQQLSVLPPFKSDQPYELFFINSMTAFFTLLRLIELAHRTLVFAIHTKTDDTSRQPALIQIQFLHSNLHGKLPGSVDTRKTTMVIFEMCQLPSPNTLVYPRMKQLLKAIFHRSKTFLVWGNGRMALSSFRIYPLFHSIPLACLHFINVQDRFKEWYNHTYPHGQECSMAKLNHSGEDPVCTCSHRPYKNSNNRWSLQLAISMIHQQFLDKSLTRNNWSQGLDVRLYMNFKDNEINYNVKSCLSAAQERTRFKLVNYIVNECLALTKLASNIDL